MELGCDVSIVSTDWFLCLFATSLPPEVAARVWDVLLFEGSKVGFLLVALFLFSGLSPCSPAQ